MQTQNPLRLLLEEAEVPDITLVCGPSNSTFINYNHTSTRLSKASSDAAPQRENTLEVERSYAQLKKRPRSVIHWT